MGLSLFQARGAPCRHPQTAAPDLARRICCYDSSQESAQVLKVMQQDGGMMSQLVD